jgi:SAM-dependent methyltransferase
MNKEKRLLRYNWTGDYKNSKLLVEMWGDYIRWEQRWKTVGKWLVKQLRRHNCQKIFDSALGDGCDSIYLVKKGFDVISNDVEKLFIKKAIKNAKKYKVQLQITNLDWRELTQKIPKGTFDAVLCLGNSLTCLFEREDQIIALREFKKILKKNGILIIDERNYQLILDNRERFLKGEYSTTGKFLYCGKYVHSKPVLIREDLIKFEVFDLRSGKKAYFFVYPFKKGELQKLLFKANFRKIEKYSDYKYCDDPLASYYTYICHR